MRSRHPRPLGIAPSSLCLVNICGRQIVQSECIVLHVGLQHRQDEAPKSLKYKTKIRGRIINLSKYAVKNLILLP
jgi:hypothetical protein